jgi:hypothetical protein
MKAVCVVSVSVYGTKHGWEMRGRTCMAGMYIRILKPCSTLLAPQRSKGYVARSPAFGRFAKKSSEFWKSRKDPASPDRTATALIYLRKGP